jgi:GNAT superfamily N-acetyltransferase
MQAPFKIRELQEGDSGAVSGLLFELGHPVDPETVSLNLRRIRNLSPLHRSFVAVRGDAVVGLISAFASPVLHRPHPIGRISILVVTAAVTGQGIGTALLLQAEAFLRNFDCDRIEVTSASHRLETHDFYRRRGYLQQGVRFAREFKGQDPG